jgi:hypothetical protein
LGHKTRARNPSFRSDSRLFDRPEHQISQMFPLRS